MALRILLVDDIQANISSLLSALDQGENQFVAVNSGRAALRVLSADSDFDLALIDVQMPEMDGFELARFMKGVERTRQIPIIFVTAHSESHYIEFKGSDVGAIDVIFKPINVTMLRSKIEVFQRLKAKRAALAQKVSELEEAKRNLQISERRAVDADKMKSTFLAHLSHEIRTPITSLIGFAEVLVKSAKEQDAIKYGEIILRSGQHLLDLLNDALDVSKIEAGQLEINLELGDVVSLVRSSVEFLQPLAEKNGVEMTFTHSDGESILCLFDRLRLRQIVTNLIGNAVKFSKGGSVSVKIETVKESRSEFVKIVVEDTGCGIEVKHHDAIFRPFTQVAEAQAESPYQGTGLGLSLSCKLANLMGGELKLESSEPGVGSVFSVRIPRAKEDIPENVPSASLEPGDVANIRLDGVKILFADDSPDNQMLLELMLPYFGAQVLSVADGQAAIDFLEKEHVDVVLMDYRMPVLNGIETTKKLRENGFDKPIVLLTANALRSDKDHALRVGASAYVTKPIDWPHLVTTINALLNASAGD